MADRVQSEHGVICRLPGEPLGYLGWPSVARMPDGTLVVASSGLRSEHICPWGKTVLNVSTDDGRTWSAPRVIMDSPIDDRDAGVVALGGRRLLVSWFTSDTRQYVDGCRQWLGNDVVDGWAETLAGWTDQAVQQWLGSWVMLSEDGGRTCGPPIQVPVSSPHGPVRLRNGSLLYLGKRYGKQLAPDHVEIEQGAILAIRSADGGRSWETLGKVPVCPGTRTTNYHEPHVVELPSGGLLGMIRLENAGPEADVTKAGLIDFSMMQSESADGGRTWTQAKPLGFHGSPPHLLRHSRGVLILSYGCRQAPFGQRAAISRDEGATWEHDWIIRDDGPDADLGYPSTVEMADGSLFTACYQKCPGDRKCSLLWSRWRLPG